MTTAPIQRRILADIIDFTVFLTLFCAVYLIVSLQHQTFDGQDGSGYSYALSVSTSIYLIIFISWLLFITLTEFRSGQSIGKRILRIKVVRQDFSSTTLFTTFIRHLFDVIDLTLLAGLVIALTNKKRQRIGDLIARTIVIRK